MKPDYPIKAEEIDLSSLIWTLQQNKGERKEGIPSIHEAKNYSLNDNEKETLQSLKDKMIIGNPTEVGNQLKVVQEHTKADELMTITMTYSLNDKLTSYQLLAEELM
ncbi:hypothetical protein [Bacillus weihaiensis]|uniref:Uncharacterized protein n=1 Tax=Bacillus weihaiensis TaxID=1547283 RepID=A0A1L3MRX4_9BACI|nr:hypothetical protein [Bacillus weihaiensis]APH05083.1 hypothetical protein A9C19_10160 [Bacillus weihaiensis]